MKFFPVLFSMIFISTLTFNKEAETQVVNSVQKNYRLYPSQNHQVETIITRHPLNQNILFASAITLRRDAFFINEGVYISTNAGLSWYGRDTLPSNPIIGHNGDPGPVIDKDGTFILTRLNSLGPPGSLLVSSSYSTNNGVNWSNDTLVIGTGINDKNLATTDDSPVSPFYGRTYVAWTRFISVFAYIYISYTTNNGQSWSTPKQVNQSLFNHHSQGVDLRVGPKGELYMCWANADRFTQFNEERLIGFGKSLDGGETWEINEKAFPVRGIRTSPFGYYSVFVVGYPRIDVDRSGGARDGWIYIVTPQKFFGAAKDSADIILNRSTDGGNTWTNGIRVNQDAPGNGKLQFMPAVRVDEGGGVNVFYYDNRNVHDTLAQIYLSRSLNGGNTFNDFLVTDHNIPLKPIPGFPIPFIGEYIGITSSFGKLFPVWMDNSTGHYQIWTAPVEITAPPLNPFQLSFPLQSDTIETFPNSPDVFHFNWTSSSVYATYKWLLGIPAISQLKSSAFSLTNSYIVTSGKLDSILKVNNVQQGNTVSAQWDVRAFRNNPPALDSLNSSNGPRQIVLKRKLPLLSNFNLSLPENNSSIQTFPDFTAALKFQWQRSGEGVKYKWRFRTPASNSIIFNFDADGNGFDSTFSIRYSKLDSMLFDFGIMTGDSITAHWNVTAFNEIDSIPSKQYFFLTFIRGTKPEILIAYDSTRAGSRIARDSVVKNLNLLNRSYSIINKGTIVGDGFPLNGYNKIIWLGGGPSTMSAAQRDSVKAYLMSGGTTNETSSKLIIFSQDFAWRHARNNQSNYDHELTNQLLGISYIADLPPSGGNQVLVGVTLNSGVADSTTGPFPDVIDRSSIENTDILYKYKSDDTYNAIGRRGINYRSALFSFDLETLLSSHESPPGSPVFRVLQSALNYVDGTVGIQSNSNKIPSEFYISQNFPNPFNPVTKINFGLSNRSNVSIKVYDILGREVIHLMNEIRDAGNYTIEFNGSNHSSGVYFYSITAGDNKINFSRTMKMILLK